ncbi:MAG: glycosyltransferase family 4 protein [Nocardiaceae bacterium]|nr:glycosyltransferase family 4 protein [Nocardiaceae bacterium]
MPSASVVYWYSEEEMSRDGGGLRVQAWLGALRELGYNVNVVPLWSLNDGAGRVSPASRLKQRLIPLPFVRRLPSHVREADVVVCTVPAVFGKALREIEPARLILDWTDLWSAWASNMTDHSLLARPGGQLQSRLWRRREHRWSSGTHINTYAGYEDFLAQEAYRSPNSVWLPTPVPFQPMAKTGKLERVGFIGNLNYRPNLLSLRSFLERYEARLRSRGITVVVAGFGSEIVGRWGFRAEVMGTVEHVSEFYSQIDAAVVPIEHGSGIKVKAVEALSYAKPVFATDHVRAGFHPDVRQFLLPMTELDGPEDVATPAIDDRTFGRYFSPDSFRDSVQALILAGR